MNMSDSEIQRMWQAINRMGEGVAALSAKIEGNHELLTEVRGDVKWIAANGCAKSGQHDDHEKRLRDVEGSRNMLAGAASLAGAVLGVVGSWLMKKVGG
jgi:hypothetical protein